MKKPKPDHNAADLTGKILIIEDDRSILDGLCMLLQYAGYEVICIDNGEFAESLVDRKSDLPKLIILDILLSGKDGRDICRKLKANKSTSAIPVIMMSAHPRAEESVKACGADDFVPKPFDTGVLLDKIKKHLS